MIDQPPPTTASGTSNDATTTEDVPELTATAPETTTDVTSTPLATNDAAGETDNVRIVVDDEITAVTDPGTDSLPQAQVESGAVGGDNTSPSPDVPSGTLPTDDSDSPVAVSKYSPTPVTDATSETESAYDDIARDDAVNATDAATSEDLPDLGAERTSSGALATKPLGDGRTTTLPNEGDTADYQLYTSDHLSTLADRLAFRAYQNAGATRELPANDEAGGDNAASEGERTAELNRRRSIMADVKRGILPFSDLEPRLTRAEIEWLLSIHESGGYSGPVDWTDAAQRKRTGLDLRGADLHDLDLSGLPLARVRFGPTGSEWLGATQPGRDWAAAHLEGANLRGAHLEGAQMREVHLQGAHLANAYLTDATLIRAHLERADLRGAHLPGADLSEAQLANADCSEAELSGVDLHGANLDNAILRGVTLAGADLHGARLERAELDQAHLEHANFNAARLDGASLNLARLDAATLHSAHLEWANLNATHLDGALLNNAHFERATLSGAYLWQADLQEAHLEGADLRGARLDGADLRRVTFDSQTTLADVSLSDRQHGAVALGDVHWGGVDLTSTNWDTLVRLGDERAVGARASLGAQRAVVRAYRQLATQLRSQGMHEEADRYTYRALVRRRIVYLRQRRILPYLFALFMRTFTGFGYKPARALVWYLVLILAFAVSYLQVGYLQVGQVLLSGGSLAQWTQSLLLSFTAFHGQGFLQPPRSIGDLTSILMVIESSIGLVLEITFIVSLALRHLGAK